MTDNRIALDVREAMRAGREPFSKIRGTVGRLEAGAKLVLIAPFEPKPLFHVLAKQGFRHDCQRTASGDWQVLFSRAEGIPATLRGPLGSLHSGDPPPLPPPPLPAPIAHPPSLRHPPPSPSPHTS